MAHFLPRNQWLGKKRVCRLTGMYTYVCQVEKADHEKRLNVCESIALRETSKLLSHSVTVSERLLLRGPHRGPSEPGARSPLLEGSNFATFTSEDILREHFLSTYKSKRCVAPGLPESTDNCISLFQRCEMRKDFPPLPAWPHTYPPSV